LRWCGVGRTASGLPVQNADFTGLLPEFTCSSAQIGTYVKKYFPSVPHYLKDVGNYALVSVAYHNEMLLPISDLQHNHPIFNTQLFIVDGSHNGVNVRPSVDTCRPSIVTWADVVRGKINNT